MTTMLIEGDDENSVASRLDALRCDYVKTALYPERHRIAVEILTLVQEDPTLKDIDPNRMRTLCTEAMFYFGDDVFDALQGVGTPPTGAATLGDKINHLQVTLQSYFDLRTLK